MTHFVVVVLILVAEYSLAIAVLAWLIRRLGASARRAVFLGCLAFGLLSGIAAALIWPLDVSALLNVPGVWLGDWVYTHAIEWIGDPHSSQAHFTIPWPLRVPQVYVLTSTGWCTLLGMVLQWPFARRGAGRPE